MAYSHSPFGDTTFTKVFVGGLAWETQSGTLLRHFEPYGAILEAVVIYDNNTGRSKGYGFVSLLSYSSSWFIAEQTSSASIVCLEIIGFKMDSLGLA